MGGGVNEKDFADAIGKVTRSLPGSIAAPIVYRLPVKKKYEGYNIVDYFVKVVPKVDKSVWINKIVKRSLLLNGIPATLDSIVKGGNITEHQSEPQIEPYVSVDIELVYQDESILVINKPAPLPMHPSGRFNKNSLTEILKLAFPNESFKLIHRLDANTTGLVVLAKNEKVVAEIANQFELKSVHKEYLTLVEGVPEMDEFFSDDKISIEKTSSGGREITGEGIDAYTKFEVLERRIDKRVTLLKVEPFSGRTNQIRVHLSNLGYPIVGDIGYKDSNYFKSNPLTYPTDCLFLHAWKLSFKINNKNMGFEASIPTKYQIVEK